MLRVTDETIVPLDGSLGFDTLIKANSQVPGVIWPVTNVCPYCDELLATKVDSQLNSRFSQSQQNTVVQ